MTIQPVGSGSEGRPYPGAGRLFFVEATANSASVPIRAFEFMESPKSGYVYVLQMEGHPYYKIGRTNNLDRRITQISPASPVALHVVHASRVGDPVWAERRLHNELADRRLNGEWFNLDDECLNIVRAALLLCQADTLLFSAIDRFREEFDTGGLGVYRIEQWGRVIALASRRHVRRLAAILDLGAARQKIQKDEDSVLEAEFVE